MSEVTKPKPAKELPFSIFQDGYGADVQNIGELISALERFADLAGQQIAELEANGDLQHEWYLRGFRDAIRSTCAQLTRLYPDEIIPPPSSGSVQ